MFVMIGNKNGGTHQRPPYDPGSQNSEITHPEKFVLLRMKLPFASYIMSSTKEKNLVVGLKLNFESLERGCAKRAYKRCAIKSEPSEEVTVFT